MTISAVTAGALIDPVWGNAVSSAINPTAWTALTLAGSWVWIGTGGQVPQYRKINDNVYVRGHIKSGTSGSTVFTLPVGFRPLGFVNLPTASGGSTPVAGLLAINNSGVATYYGGGTTDVSFEFCISTTA